LTEDSSRQIFDEFHRVIDVLRIPPLICTELGRFFDYLKILMSKIF
jgi:hypothetical protein